MDNDRVAELLKECARMYEFDHPNLLKLIGVCLDGGPAPYIVMPFMVNGSLLSYLKQERENLVLQPNTTELDDAVCIASMYTMLCTVAITTDLLSCTYIGWSS